MLLFAFDSRFRRSVRRKGARKLRDAPWRWILGSTTEQDIPGDRVGTQNPWADDQEIHARVPRRRAFWLTRYQSWVHRTNYGREAVV